jgi:hypothetical protein
VNFPSAFGNEKQKPGTASGTGFIKADKARIGKNDFRKIPSVSQPFVAWCAALA